MTNANSFLDSFFGGPLDMVSSAMLLISIAILGVLIYVSIILRQIQLNGAMRYQRLVTIEKILRVNNATRQSRVKQLASEGARPPITGSTVLPRTTAGRMSVIDLGRSTDGERHDRQLRPDS